ncbi:MAG: hypothetical protein IJU56_07260 [Clostridia bacterium]|nr:hypothetical protein [Clostridia bacterium]
MPKATVKRRSTGCFPFGNGREDAAASCRAWAHGTQGARAQKKQKAAWLRSLPRVARARRRAVALPEREKEMTGFSSAISFHV